MDIFCVAKQHVAMMKNNLNPPIQLTPKGFLPEKAPFKRSVCFALDIKPIRFLS